jgi:tRNA nucleotidyltransferase (CCA-adding enzyme)
MLPVERLEFFSFMHYPKEVIQKVLHFSRNFWVDTGDMVAFKRAMAEIGIEDFKRLLIFQEGQARWDYNPARQNHVARNRECYEAIVAGGEPILRQDLAVDGNDLRALGLQGPAIAKGLNTALEWVYLHPEDNRKARLLALLREEVHE